MLKIRDKDRLFAEKVTSVFNHCSVACLFREDYGCKDCLFFNFALDLEANNALFLTLQDLISRLEEHYDRKPSQAAFLKCWAYSVLVIYSANGEKLPFLNQEIANKMIRKAQVNPTKFFNRARRKLLKMNALWFEELRRMCQRADINGCFWNSIVLFLALLLKAKEWEEFSKKTEVQETPEELHQAILTHLRQERRAS